MKIQIEYDETRIETLQECFEEIVNCVPKTKLRNLIGNLNDMYLLITAVKKGMKNVSKSEK